jgi:hypothetical protein
MESRSKATKSSNGAAMAPPVFNAQAFLDSAGVSKSIAQYGRGGAIFTQGDDCEHVMYIQSGGVHAGAQHPDRRGPDRSALQLERAGN